MRIETRIDRTPVSIYRAIVSHSPNLPIPLQSVMVSVRRDTGSYLRRTRVCMCVACVVERQWRRWTLTIRNTGQTETHRCMYVQRIFASAFGRPVLGCG